MRKIAAAVAVLVIIMLSPYLGFPMAIKSANASLSEYSTVSDLPYAHVESSIAPTSVTSQVITIGSDNINVKQYIFNINGEEYIQLEVGLKTFTIPDHEPQASPSPDPPAGDYPVYKIITELYPVSKLIAGLEGLTSTDPMPKYTWDGVKFVQAPGNSTKWVKYDHPDNYDTYHPGETNSEYSLPGITRTIEHIPQSTIENAKVNNDIATVISALVGVALAALVIPEPTTKIVAGAAALIAAILTAANLIVRFWLNDVVQTELGDGWSYVWGEGSWWLFHWFWMSVGAWRDWGWCYVFLDNGSTSGTKTFTWVDCTYEWNGAICQNQIIYYYDENWNYLGERFRRVIIGWL